MAELADAQLIILSKAVEAAASSVGACLVAAVSAIQARYARLAKG